MTAYRRLRIPGGTYFFTVGLERRGTDILTANIDDLRLAWIETRAERPFLAQAVVILPDHLHAVWTLPEGDTDFSTRWRLIKARFSRSTGIIGHRSASKVAKQERGLWQRRFWEHAIRDEDELATCVHYCWTNPVRHGLVSDPDEWPHFRRMGARTHHPPQDG